MEVPETAGNGQIFPPTNKEDQLHRTVHHLSACKLWRYYIAEYICEIFSGIPFGLTPNKSATYQVFSEWQLMEKMLEYGNQLHHPSIKFKESYDHIARLFIKVYTPMREFNIPIKLVSMMRLTATNT